MNVASGAAWGGAPNGSVYGMAKMGVIGLTRAMATEGRSSGITANVVAPYAKTRAGTGFGTLPWSEELGDWLHPRKVAPLVGWLAHASCPLSGECLTVGGGHFALVELVMHEGLVDREPTIESVAAGIDAIVGGAGSPIVGGGAPALRHMLEGFDGPGVS